MVSRRKLDIFDSSGITARLFNNKAMGDMHEENLPSYRLIEEDDAPTFLFYKGSGDGVNVLYFPAEYDTEETIALLASGFTRYGMNLLSMNYRRDDKGQVRVGSLFEDAENFVDFALSFLKGQDQNGKTVIMGRSLGCGAAIDVAVKVQKDILCLVLESGFDRTIDFLSGKRVEIDAGLFEEDPFDNRNKMKGFEKPVMFIHSPRDEVLSLEQIEWLVAESRSKATQFQVAPSGTREELAMQAPVIYAEQLKDYINMRMGIRPPSRRRSKRRYTGTPSAQGLVKIEKLYG